MKLRKKPSLKVSAENLAKKEESEEKEISEKLNMKKTLQMLLLEAEEIAENAEDYLYPASSVFAENGNLVLPEGEFPLSRFSLSQLGTKIGVPPRYLFKCYEKGGKFSELADENINEWLTEYGRDLFIRTHEEKVRGILSSRYSVCDSDEIVRRVMGSSLSEYDVKGSFISPERLHIRLFSPEMLPVENEDLFAGVYLDSSDVGRNNLIVTFGIFKQICTNGLCVSKGNGVLFKQKHIGIDADEFSSGLVASLDRIPVLCEEICSLVESATEERVRNPVKEISSLIKSSEEAEKVEEHLKSPTKWGIVNALTEYAQKFTLERRIEFEKIAGNYLAA